MEIKKIYFDMDQVLADFNGGVRKLCGMEVPDRDKATAEQMEAMWAKVRKVEHFFDQLDMMPGAGKMFRKAYSQYGDKVEILSGIPRPDKYDEDVAGDKERWIRRHFGPDVKINLTYKEEKLNYCTGPECILIDDLASNVADWKSKNGTAIQHKNADETIERLCELGVLDQKMCRKQFAGITKYADEFEKDARTVWPDASGHAGTKEDPIPWPHPDYSDVVWNVGREVMAFVTDYPDMNLTSYSKILEESGLGPDAEAIYNADVSELDARTVLALLVFVYRSERFCDGAIEEYIENGLMVKWLRRLEELDK